MADLSSCKYCGFTGLDSKFAEAELDSFTLDKREPLARTTNGKRSFTYWLMTEKNIVRLLGRNLQVGFRMLLKEYKEPIYWHIRRITVNSEDAQDATQETFIRVFRSFSQYDRNRSFTAWLYRIATNEALRIVENRHPTVNVEDNAEAMSVLADEYVDFTDIEAVLLQKAILSLPRKQRLTFNLRYYDELSFGEIAEITDTTPDGAKANWHNAKVKITNYLKEHDG